MRIAKYADKMATEVRTLGSTPRRPPVLVTGVSADPRGIRTLNAIDKEELRAETAYS